MHVHGASCMLTRPPHDDICALIPYVSQALIQSVTDSVLAGYEEFVIDNSYLLERVMTSSISKPCL